MRYRRQWEKEKASRTGAENPALGLPSLTALRTMRSNWQRAVVQLLHIASPPANIPFHLTFRSHYLLF
jgi:hypothetical protein